MNQITIAGHLGADPEVRFTSSGQKVTTLRVATRCRKTGKGEDTIWWRVSIWGEQFDKMIAYLKKGSPVMASGEFNKPEIFTDREGKPQISMSLTAYSLWFNPFGKGENNGMNVHQEQSSEFSKNETMMSSATSYGSRQDVSHISDDEVPF